MKRRRFLGSCVFVPVLLAGCMSDDQRERGEVKIENSDSAKHTIHMSISELMPNAQTASTATTDTTPEFRLDERYTITPDSTKRVGFIKYPDQTGHVKITAELDTNVTTERWIAIPTTYI